MISTAFKIPLTYNQKGTFNIKPPKEYSCGFVQINQGQDIKVTFKKGYYSQVKAWAAKNILIPCFAGLGKEIKVEIIKNNNIPEPLFLTVVIFSKEKIEDFLKRDINLRILPAKDYGTTLSDTTPMLLYRNKRRHNVFLASWGWYTLEESAQGEKLFINKELIAFRERQSFDYGDGLIWNKIGAWLKPESAAYVIGIDPYPDADYYFRDHIIVGDNEFDPQEIFGAYLINTATPGVSQIPKWPFASEKPTVTPEPVPMGKYTYPYLIPPDMEYELVPSIPKPVPIDVTGRYRNKGLTTQVTINRPNETRTVEALPSPFGAVRKSADAMGRMRTTGAGINYNAGKLNTTDTDAHLVYTGYGSKSISLYAKTGAYKIRILTLYDWLIGKTTADEDYIYIDEGQSFNVNIEAREVEITAESATASEIYYEVEK